MGFPPTISRSRCSACTASSRYTVKLNTTSSAVQGCPSENFRSGRSFNVYSSPSFETDQDEASDGSVLSVWRLMWMRSPKRRSNTDRDGPSIAKTGLKVRGVVLSATTSWPPRVTSEGAAARRGAAPARQTTTARAAHPAHTTEVRGAPVETGMILSLQARDREARSQRSRQCVVHNTNPNQSTHRCQQPPRVHQHVRALGGQQEPAPAGRWLWHAQAKERERRLNENELR